MPVQGRKKQNRKCEGCQLLSMVLNYLKALNSMLFFALLFMLTAKITIENSKIRCVLASVTL